MTDVAASDVDASDVEAERGATGLVLEFTLDAPPERVWRAIETPHLRERWLPGRPLTDAEHRTSDAGREIRFRMRDDAPPYAETAVTFHVRDGADGGSVLRIVHEPPAVPSAVPVRGPVPANDRGGPLMRAA